MKGSRTAVATMLLALAGVHPGFAQEPTPPEPAPQEPAAEQPALQIPDLPTGLTVPDTAANPQERRLPTPRGAFVRSLVIPGWGQASFGHYTRASVYFATRTASGFMLVKTMAKISEARDVERRQITLVRDSLVLAAANDTALFRRISQPGGLDQAVDAHPRVTSVRTLIDARKQQREDWITWSIFWLLASGVDAYVTAHLADFPTQLSASPSGDGGVRVQVNVPTGRVP